MPRPLKNVPADTLGGKIRAARQRLHLSLSQVAGTEYSTSLISQIERNKIEPSLNSLKYLSAKLNLSIDELTALAQQHRELEAAVSTYQQLEDLRVFAEHLLDSNQPKEALALLEQLSIATIPTSLRWRIIALRGQCHFTRRHFIDALKDFQEASDFTPNLIPQENLMEAILLRLHLAATLRELGQYDASYEEYSKARVLMTTSTPLRYLAEAHWGISLVLFEKAHKAEEDGEQATDKASDNGEQDHSAAYRQYMEHALKHAERANTLYDSADELLRATLLNCQIALIEQALGHLESAQKRLQNILNEWQPTLQVRPVEPSIEVADKKLRYTLKERANVVSAAACYLANIEIELHQCQQALAHIDQALEAGKQTYILRRADAYTMKGQILAECNDADGAIKAFQLALEELKNTDRVGAKIRAHKMLGAYYISVGRQKEGESQLEKVLQLANVPTQFNATASNENSLSTFQEG